ncbi:ComEA family DNA-binding protein [Sphaerisporangium sp. NPDC051011]|uniref:ComEA family DNA-binding protein n=1 Tax=Sphaerisporangium sp. NPDC051011 TaxID=3155792 RepID=UPI0033C1D710
MPVDEGGEYVRVRRADLRSRDKSPSTADETGVFARVRRADSRSDDEDVRAAVADPWSGDREESRHGWVTGEPGDLDEPGKVRNAGDAGDYAPSVRLRSEPLPFRSLRTRVSDVLAQCGPLLDPGRPGLRVLVVLGLLAALIGGIQVWRSRPAAEPVSPPLPAAASELPTGASRPPTGASGLPARSGLSAGSPQPALSGVSTIPSLAAQVIVHVTGKVKKPGIVTLPSGSRVADAVKAAGGARSGETGALNLARKLVDGEQIVVGAPAGATIVTAPAPIPGVGEAPVEVLDLNTATPSQLETLPGVGEVLAARIVEYRQSHAGFRSVAQLREVTGIGERKFADLRDKVRV